MRPWGLGGLTPALPNGHLPVQPQELKLPDNVMFREGTGRGGKPFADTYSPLGRDPSHQPQVGDTDGGNGYYRDELRTMQGAPEQQYVTGIDRVDGQHAREYAVPNGKGGDVSFDGHTWRGVPPTEYFTEVKGNYAFMKPEWLHKTFDGWIERQLTNQAEALAHSGTPGYVHELVFTQKSVMDEFDAYLPPKHPLRDHLVLRFEPMP